MSVDMSDLQKLYKALSETVQHEKVNRKAVIATHTEATQRIFPSRGASKDSKNRVLGAYSKGSQEIRKKKGWHNRGINLQFTRQLVHAWNVAEQGNEWISAFTIHGRRGSSQSNDEIADSLEDRFTTLGKIFALTKEEEEFYVKQLEKYQKKLIGR